MACSGIQAFFNGRQIRLEVCRIDVVEHDGETGPDGRGGDVRTGVGRERDQSACRQRIGGALQGQRKRRCPAIGELHLIGGVELFQPFAGPLEGGFRPLVYRVPER